MPLPPPAKNLPHTMSSYWALKFFPEMKTDFSVTNVYKHEFLNKER